MLASMRTTQGGRTRPLPTDALTCARLAHALIAATTAAPDHPVVIAGPGRLPETIRTINRLLRRAASDPELRDRISPLRAHWTTEVRRLRLR